jgi:hypothetical protein
MAATQSAAMIVFILFIRSVLSPQQLSRFAQSWLHQPSGPKFDGGGGCFGHLRACFVGRATPGVSCWRSRAPLMQLLGRLRACLKHCRRWIRRSSGVKLHSTVAAVGFRNTLRRRGRRRRCPASAGREALRNDRSIRRGAITRHRTFCR